MSDIIGGDELFGQPAQKTLDSLRAAGLLQSETASVTWKQDADELEPPAEAAFGTLSPRVPFNAQGFLNAQDCDSYQTNIAPSVSISFGSGRVGTVFNSFVGLGGGSKCIAWVRLGVDPDNSLRVRGTGNPTEVVIDGSATGGQPVSVPFALTASQDGQIVLFVQPKSVGMFGFWLGTNLHVL